MMRNLKSELPHPTNVTSVEKSYILLWHCYLAGKKMSLNGMMSGLLFQFILTSLLSAVFLIPYMMTVSSWTQGNCLM